MFSNRKKYVSGLNAQYPQEFVSERDRYKYGALVMFVLQLIVNNYRNDIITSYDMSMPTRAVSSNIFYLVQ